MRIIILSILLLTLLGCSGAKAKKESSYVDSLYGSWTGTLEWKATTKIEGNFGGTEGTYFVTLSLCGENKKVILTNNSTNEKYYMYFPENGYVNRQNLIFYSIGIESENDPTWIESSVWSFAVKDDGTALVQWNRLVSNPKLANDALLRVFGQLGSGKFKRTSNSCLS